MDFAERRAAPKNRCSSLTCVCSGKCHLTYMYEKAEA